VGHAKILLGIENPEMRLLLLTKIISGDLNVRQTERQAHILKAKEPIAMPLTPRELSESLMKIEKQIAKQLAANVSLEHSAKRGKIIIEYNGERELLRIVQSMGIE
jgi:ParB family chromosome partitioning protein